MNINDVDPSEVEPVSDQTNTNRSPASNETPLNLHQIDPSAVQTEDEYNQSTYGTPGEQTLAGIEGLSRGVIGRAATAAVEKGLGFPDLTPEAQAAREEVNPVTAGGAEAAGFLGSAVAGTGEAALLGKLGEGAKALSGLGEATTLIPRLAATGIQTGAEFAALAADNEVARAINQDPGQTLGTAAMNIGLAGIMGGAGGAVLGTVSPLWKSAMNRIGVEKLANDFMAESKALNSVEDPLSAATNEISNALAEDDQMWRAMSETKPEFLAKGMPEATPENVAKIDTQLNGISDQMTSTIEKAASSVKTKSAVPYLAEDLNNWQEVVTRPDATMAEKYAATNKLKTTLEGYASWGNKFGASEESTARGALGRMLSNIIRPALEDQKVWGAAGKVQEVTNDAIANMIRANKDFRPQVTTSTLGENVVAPEKVQTLLNQSNAGKVGRKTTVVGNWLDARQKYADVIARVHIENGLEPPIAAKLNGTPVLDHALNTPITPGVALARWVNKKGGALAGRAIGETAAAGVGGGLGSLVGHPLVGAWMGEKVLTPVFSALAKPLAQTAINATAAKASVDYVGNVIKGQNLLKNAAGNFFKAGAEIIPKELMPNAASREKLEKSLDYASVPQNQMHAGGDLGHYLPAHATAAAQTTAAATNYFTQLKPKTIQLSPLDEPTPVDPGKQAAYERQLDIATQPLLVLKHAREGTLQTQDLATLNAVYPGLLPKIGQETYESMVKSISEGHEIPYKQRVSLSLLTGQNLDSTTKQPLMAAILAANGRPGPMPPQPMKQKKVSKSTASVMEKSTALLQTPGQNREARSLRS